MKTKLLFLSLLFTSSLFGREVRTWTAADGRTLEAELLSVEENGVKVRRKTDGKVMELAPAMLSEDDRKYVKELQEAEAEAADI